MIKRITKYTIRHFFEFFTEANVGVTPRSCVWRFELLNISCRSRSLVVNDPLVSGELIPIPRLRLRFIYTPEPPLHGTEAPGLLLPWSTPVEIPGRWRHTLWSQKTKVLEFFSWFLDTLLSSDLQGCDLVIHKRSPYLRKIIFLTNPFHRCTQSDLTFPSTGWGDWSINISIEEEDPHNPTYTGPHRLRHHTISLWGRSFLWVRGSVTLINEDNRLSV